MGTTTVETKLHAKAISGSDIYDVIGATKVTDEVVTVQKLLGPYPTICFYLALR